MEKYVNLTTPLYDRVNAICIKCRYDKREGGYLVEAEPITRDEHSGKVRRRQASESSQGIARTV